MGILGKLFLGTFVVLDSAIVCNDYKSPIFLVGPAAVPSPDMINPTTGNSAESAHSY